MTEGRFIDFDVALAETSGEPIVVHLYGRDWTLPADLPAKAMLKVIRMTSNGGGELDVGQQLDLLSHLVPTDVLEGWLDAGLGIKSYALVIRTLMAVYQGAAPEEALKGVVDSMKEEDEAEAEPKSRPKRAARKVAAAGG